MMLISTYSNVNSVREDYKQYITSAKFADLLGVPRPIDPCDLMQKLVSKMLNCVFLQNFVA